MPSSIEIILKKKAYNPLTDSGDGVIVFDDTIGEVYVGGDCFCSEVKDVVFDQSTGILTILKTDRTEREIDFSLVERSANKVTSVSLDSTDDEYPSAKCIYNYSKDKPVVVWKAQSVENGILANQTNISENPTWQITGLDLSQYQKVKLFIRSGGSGTDTTPSAIITISLDDINKSPFGHFIGSSLVQNPNNSAKLLAVSAVISEDKTSVVFNRCIFHYGTVTDANNNGRVLYKIVGYTGTAAQDV